MVSCSGAQAGSTAPLWTIPCPFPSPSWVSRPSLPLGTTRVPHSSCRHCHDPDHCHLSDGVCRKPPPVVPTTRPAVCASRDLQDPAVARSLLPHTPFGPPRAQCPWERKAPPLLSLSQAVTCRNPGSGVVWDAGEHVNENCGQGTLRLPTQTGPCDQPNCGERIIISKCSRHPASLQPPSP